MTRQSDQRDAPKRELLVKRLRDGLIAERRDVTGWSEQKIRDTIGGMLINADTDNWVIVDTDWNRETT